MEEKELLDKLRRAASDKVGEGATGVKSKRARHKTQASLIVDTALRMAPSLFKGDDVAVVDLGAGKGGLADAVVTHKRPGAVVFVERESRRHKADGKLRRLEDLEVERVRGDLADVDLARVGTLKGRTCVGVAKHLCGSATDLALNAFVALSEARGVAVATCCHHRCEWSSYVGRDYFRAKTGGSAADFARIARWSSWACQVANGTTGEHAAPVCADDLRDYTSEQKREIGRRCKALLDAGRLDFLRRHGLAGARSAYCDVELSPENWLLVAERRCVPCADAAPPVVRKSPCSPVLPRTLEEGVCGCVVI
jgi:tRNA:m4X modification enzyme